MSAGWLRSILITDPVIVLLTVMMGSVSVVATILDSTGKSAHRVARLWSRMLLGVSGVRVTIEGLEKIHPDQSYVLAANHRSYMDTPVMLAHIPVQFRFFAKQHLFRIPFIGTHLKRAGHIPVIREDPRASLKSMSEGARLIRERGLCVLIFPEGGRSPRLREFKEGAAYIAIKAGVPLVPIGITGTREILPIGSAHVRRGRVQVRIGDPIATEGMKTHDREKLTQRLKQQIAGLGE